MPRGVLKYNAERSRKLSSVSSALDLINGRMVVDAVVLGAQQYRGIGKDGKNIKFVNAIRRAIKSLTIRLPSKPSLCDDAKKELCHPAQPL